MVTILVYTSISFRLAFAKRMMNYENDVAKTKPIRFFVAFAHGGVKKHDSIKQRRYNPEASGWFSECVPYVSNIAWSTLDLAILYVSSSEFVTLNYLTFSWITDLYVCHCWWFTFVEHQNQRIDITWNPNYSRRSILFFIPSIFCCHFDSMDRYCYYIH